MLLMLAHLLETLRHLFTPHHTNNHRPKLLYPASLVSLAAIVLSTNVSVRALAGVTGSVLGYASDITSEQVLEQVNQQRVERGLSVFRLDDTLSDAARRKASDMFTFDYWAHTNPQNGQEPWVFFDAVGYRYRYAGENLARDFATTTPMIEAWMNSQSHRDNVLSPRYVDTGIAVVNGKLGGIETTLVVQLFGARQTAAAAPRIIPEAKAESFVKGEETPQAIPETISPPQESSVPRVIPQVLEEPEQKRLISPFVLSRSLAIAALALVGGVTVIDAVIVWRRKTHRLAGRNWAHLTFLAGMMLVLVTLSQGVIQ